MLRTNDVQDFLDTLYSQAPSNDRLAVRGVIKFTNRVYITQDYQALVMFLEQLDPSKLPDWVLNAILRCCYPLRTKPVHPTDKYAGFNVWEQARKRIEAEYVKRNSNIKELMFGFN